jgi:hypothetical protein
LIELGWKIGIKLILTAEEVRVVLTTSGKGCAEATAI